ncbi:MAG: aminopeptidase, partial [Planctomycetota bacterium]
MDQNLQIDCENLLGAIYGSQEIWKNLEILCDDFGSRFGGTPGERMCRDFLQSKFQEYGLSSCEIHEYSYSCWKRGKVSLHIQSPITREIPAISLPYCPKAKVQG